MCRWYLVYTVFKYTTYIVFCTPQYFALLFSTMFSVLFSVNNLKRVLNLNEKDKKECLLVALATNVINFQFLFTSL